MDETTTFRAGDTVSWSRVLPLYPPADGWSLKYTQLHPAGKVEIAATPDGDAYTVTLSATATAAIPAGRAILFGRVEKGAGEALVRVSLGQSPLEVLPDLAAADSFDGRTQAEIAMADARAALQAYLAGGKRHVQSDTLAGQQMTFRSIGEIQQLIQELQREVAAGAWNHTGTHLAAVVRVAEAGGGYTCSPTTPNRCCGCCRATRLPPGTGTGQPRTRPWSTPWPPIRS